MKLYTSIFSTIAITVASFFGFVPDDRLFVLQNKISNLESKVQTLEKTPKQVTVVQEPASEPLLGAYNITGGGSYRLKTSAGLSDSTINLSSFKEPVSNIPYTLTYLNTTIGYATIEPQFPDRTEFISFTGITQNSDGSAQLTGVTRGINRTTAGSACTASTTLAVRHPAQSTLIYTSDSPCHFGQYAVKQNDETISGSWTVPAPTAGGNPATKTYVDATVNGGAVSYDKIAVAGTAGETVSAGQVLYLNTADGEWYKAGVATPNASTTILGIAQGSGVDGGTIASGVVIHGLDANQSGLTVGANYFLGTTAGTISTATSSRVIGKARSTTNLYVDTTFQDNFFTRSGGTVTTAPGYVYNFTATTTVVATSTAFIGSFPAYNIGKNYQIITTTGTTTFNVPSGVTKLYVRLVGGGGGSGGVVSTASGAAAGGGGGGEYAEGFIDVTGTSSIPVSVGVGGTAGANTGTNGGNGATTGFGIGALYMDARGGTGGTGGAHRVPGSKGGAGWGTSSNTQGGIGGGSVLGMATYPDTQSSSDAGNAGSNYGGGASGAQGISNLNVGAAGAQGEIIISW